MHSLLPVEDQALKSVADLDVWNSLLNFLTGNSRECVVRATHKFSALLGNVPFERLDHERKFPFDSADARTVRLVSRCEVDVQCSLHVPSAAYN